MSNKASTPANASPLTVKEAEQPDIVKKIGNTTYRVKIHFSTTSKETMSDKIKRLIMNDCGKISYNHLDQMYQKILSSRHWKLLEIRNSLKTQNRKD